MKNIVIDGKKVIIRQVAKDDASKLIDCINTISRETDFLLFGPGDFGLTVEEEKKFIENVLKKKNDLMIVAELDGEIIGSLNFSGGARKRNAHVGEFGISVLKKYWGYGIGEELIKFLINWGKTSGIRKINLRVRSDNKRAISLYKKLGFVKEGLLSREVLIEDKFYDSLLMGLCID